MSHASHKVAVGGGNAAFALGQNTHVAAQAGAAGGGGDDAARVHKGGGVAPDDALAVDLHGGGDDDAPHAPGDLFALQNVVGGLHVLDAAVGAGADDHLVDLDGLAVAGGMGVFRQVGVADGGLQRVQVNDDGALVLGVVVGGVGLPGALAAGLQVGFAGLVHREDAVFGAGFDGHVADAQPVLHGQAGNALAGKFQALVQRAGNADGADQVQDHVLAGDRGVQPAFQLHLDGGGHLEPCLAGRHAGGHVGGADAGGEGPHRAVGAGVAVGADDAVAGGDDALLRQKRVLNAHLAHVKKVEDVVFVGKVAAAFGLLGALDVLVGHKVVQHNVDLFVVVD